MSPQNTCNGKILQVVGPVVDGSRSGDSVVPVGFDQRGM